ncbi:MAG: c-type cytochrome [Methylococcales bacterium]|nr:c-type cytochrome [Methylococcales bacterium]
MMRPELWALILALLLTACAARVSQTTTGFGQEMREEMAQTGIDQGRSGEAVYRYRCQGCHGKNTQGAPLPGDRDEWGRRLKQGRAVVLRHALEGYNQTMPPKGGCMDCSAEEVERAMDYMLDLDAIPWAELTPERL